MNEPQLSEKLNRKFHDLFFPYDETFVFPDDPERIKHFLATALEEEREAMIEDFAKLKGVGKKTIEKMLTAQYANQLKEDR